MRSLIKNKKAEASSILTFLILIFFLGISFLLTAYVIDIFKTDIIDSTQLNQTNVSSSVSDRLETMSTSSIQSAFVMFCGVLIIGMMVSAFLVRVHPAWLFLYIFMLGITIFVAVPLANAYEMVMEVDAINAIASQQTMMNWIMEHIVLLLLGAGAISMIITLAKLPGRDF